MLTAHAHLYRLCHPPSIPYRCNDQRRGSGRFQRLDALEAGLLEPGSQFRQGEGVAFLGIHQHVYREKQRKRLHLAVLVNEELRDQQSAARFQCPADPLEQRLRVARALGVADVAEDGDIVLHLAELMTYLLDYGDDLPTSESEFEQDTVAMDLEQEMKVWKAENRGRPSGFQSELSEMLDILRGT